MSIDMENAKQCRVSFALKKDTQKKITEQNHYRIRESIWRLMKTMGAAHCHKHLPQLVTSGIPPILQ